MLANRIFVTKSTWQQRHEETLRLALLNEDPLAPLQYPCVLSAIYVQGKFHRDWILQPLHKKSEGHHCHCVLIDGILFVFYVTSHSLPAVFTNVCINKKNEMSVVMGDIEKIPFLAECASDLGVAIRSRKQPGKGSLRSYE